MDGEIGEPLPPRVWRGEHDTIRGIADELLPILLKASAPQLLVLRDVWRRVDERVHTDYYAELAAKLRDALVLAYPDFAAESWRSKKSASGPEAPADASE